MRESGGVRKCVAEVTDGGGESARGIIPVNVFPPQSQDNTASGFAASLRVSATHRSHARRAARVNDPAMGSVSMVFTRNIGTSKTFDIITFFRDVFMTCLICFIKCVFRC